MNKISIELCKEKVHAYSKAPRHEDGWLYAFLSLALNGGESSDSRRCLVVSEGGGRYTDVLEAQ
jgi:hypothetical protein